jgi:hypothetical protein
MAVTVAGGIGNAIAVQHPGITAGRRITVLLAQKAQAVTGRLEIIVTLEKPRGHGEGKHITTAADQMPGSGVNNAAVVTQIMKKAAALPINTAGVIKIHRVLDMTGEEVAAAEIG